MLYGYISKMKDAELDAALTDVRAYLTVVNDCWMSALNRHEKEGMLYDRVVESVKNRIRDSGYRMERDLEELEESLEEDS